MTPDTLTPVNLLDKFSRFDDHWHPRIVGELNGQQVKLAKLLGDFPWHHHADEDELFFVVKGRLTLRMHHGDVHLNEGEFYIVPRGVAHQPVAPEEVWVLLFEPAATKHTGNVRTAQTRDTLEWL